MKNQKAFSLIEILIATIILTISVFGVFKIIGENYKIYSNLSQKTTLNFLFPSFFECMKNLSGSSLIKDDKDFYISLRNCSVVDYKTGITINNIDYILYGSGIGNGSFDLYIITDTFKDKNVLKLY